jgi:CheY-like chemotaxis protein
MTEDDLLRYYNRFKFREDISHDLTKYRVTDILLVSTFYDAFIFEQDGFLSEQLFGEYRQLNLSLAPRITSVPSGGAAVQALSHRKFDLLITTLRVGDVQPEDLAARAKQARPDLPMLLLLTNPADLASVEANRARYAAFDDVFLWSGDPKVFLAMIKNIEDRRNLDHDTLHGLVRVILLIEDSVHDYSQFLPLLYGLIYRQTAQLISEEVTESYRRLRMSLRPKVILAHDAAEAEHVFRAYKDYLICILTDVQFERGGTLDEHAGIRFVERVREMGCYVPVVLQSQDPANEDRAHALGARFLHKASPHLLSELRQFIIDELGFGDFMGHLPRVPGESIVFHASRNHFSGWLIAHGEVAYAKKIQPVKVSDFPDLAALRRYLIDVFDEMERARSRGRLVDTANWEQVSREQVVRLAPGSLGGKGRGLAFLNALLYSLDFGSRFPDVDITLPLTAIVGTDEFDRFLEHNGISAADLADLPDEDVRARFLAGDLSPDLVDRLAALVDSVRRPLAVRSSGLLEDSQAIPFAGVYKTFMLPNRDRDPHVRFEELCDAVKLVFASVFERHAREYIEGVRFKLDEEKMAVVIQEIAGATLGAHHYPDVSGGAQSYNFYPTGQLRPGDGIASVALGLGKAVLEGGRVLRFCPRFPDVEILSPEDVVANSQHDFWAIRLDGEAYGVLRGDEGTLARLPLSVAEQHGTLHAVGSVWDREDSRLVDRLDVPGPRVVTFANVLKYGVFPLAHLLEDLLRIGEKALGVPVEIEFAANLTPKPGAPRPAFYLLQVRPLHVDHEEVEVGDTRRGESPGEIVHTDEALGNGVIRGVSDVVFVDRDAFSPTGTLAVQQEVARLNRGLLHAGRRYVLVGPGRWGSRDRFLGVPVTWPDISAACAIVEADTPDFRIDASQGTHFLHNLVAFKVGYLKVRHGSERQWIDWEALAAAEVVERSPHCVHVRTAAPLTVRMDGRSGWAAIVRT